MLFVTLHGGKPQTDPRKNNVHAHDKHGKRITSSVLRGSGEIFLDELRGIYLAGKYLYVVNGNRKENSVLCYKGSDTRYKLVSTFVPQKTCKGIEHPFDMTFDGAGYCYVSSQDTNIVTRLKVSADGRSAAPAPQAPALPVDGTFYPGTFVASSVGTPGSAITPVKAPAGLEYSGSGEDKHSVRGLVWANNALYVADEPAGRVKVYDKHGKFLGQSNGVGNTLSVGRAVTETTITVNGKTYVVAKEMATALARATQYGSSMAVAVDGAFSGPGIGSTGSYITASRGSR